MRWNNVMANIQIIFAEILFTAGTIRGQMNEQMNRKEC